MTNKFYLLLLLILSACSADPNRSPRWGEVVGDSVAYGFGSTDSSVNLTACLSRITGHRFVNSAISGTTSRDWLGRLKAIKAGQPKLIFISLGGNDLQASLAGKLESRNPWNDRFPADETLRNMARILTELKDTGADLIYLGINPPRVLSRPQTFLLDNRLARLQDEVAPAAGALVLRDAFDGMWLNSEYMFDDIHPNDRGYGVLCERLRTAMAGDPRFAKHLR